MQANSQASGGSGERRLELARSVRLRISVDRDADNASVDAITPGLYASLGMPVHDLIRIRDAIDQTIQEANR